MANHMPYTNNRFANEKHVAAPTGDNVTVRGQVVSVKEHHDPRFGPSWKMTVKVQTPDGSWLAWGTVPRALANVEKGATVEFTANLVAGRDPHFVFAKRPRNAKVVNTVPPGALARLAYPVGDSLAATLASPQYEGLNPLKGGEESTEDAPEPPARPSLAAVAAQLDATRERSARPRQPKEDLTVEREHGETYSRSTFAVYKHGVYPRHSVLAGQPSRTFVDGGFATAAEAQAKYPTARVLAGSTHVPVAQMVAHLPDEDDDADTYRDTGTYRGGYRTFRDGTVREDFGADR